MRTVVSFVGCKKLKAAKSLEVEDCHGFVSVFIFFLGIDVRIVSRRLSLLLERIFYWGKLAVRRRIIVNSELNFAGNISIA